MARTPSAARVMKRKATASVPSLPRRTPSQPAVQQPNQPECGRDTSVGRCGGWNRSRKRRDTGVAGCDRRAAAPGSVHPHGPGAAHRAPGSRTRAASPAGLFLKPRQLRKAKRNSTRMQRARGRSWRSAYCAGAG
ncbi:hypothetical protein PO909_017039 [Leuciscus waleckii]